MAMPSGDSPEDAQTSTSTSRATTRRWPRRDLARRLALARLALGLRDRSRGGAPLLGLAVSLHPPAAGIYPVDSFGGYTTELAGPATASSSSSPASSRFAVALIVGHLVWGQKF